MAQAFALALSSQPSQTDAPFLRSLPGREPISIKNGLCVWTLKYSDRTSKVPRTDHCGNQARS